MRVQPETFVHRNRVAVTGLLSRAPALALYLAALPVAAHPASAGPPCTAWLQEDAAYLVTGEERKAFNNLNTDDERMQFIDMFWFRRDPTPATGDNEFKDEHYRRLAYANDRFSSGEAGWKTDRGRIYILFGPADEVKRYPSAGVEEWRYRWIDRLGRDAVFEFVDADRTGRYVLTPDPLWGFDGPLVVPGNLLLVAASPVSDPIERARRFSGRTRRFRHRFMDLEALVSSSLPLSNPLPFKVHADFRRLTGFTVLTNITIVFDRHELLYKSQDGPARSGVNLYARITSSSRRVVNLFEVTIADELPANPTPDVQAKVVYQDRSRSLLGPISSISR
jgi:GWxTD domain-containing protein